jgi:hypothetical protein
MEHTSASTGQNHFIVSREVRDLAAENPMVAKQLRTLQVRHELVSTLHRSCDLEHEPEFPRAA